MEKTKSFKIIPGQIEFTPEYAGLVFEDMGYVERKLDESRKPEDWSYGESNFYLAITPKGAEHFSEMKPYVDEVYRTALMVLGIISKAA
jgi:DNA-binding MarR family transcriptional regulator